MCDSLLRPGIGGCCTRFSYISERRMAETNYSSLAICANTTNISSNRTLRSYCQIANMLWKLLIVVVCCAAAFLHVQAIEYKEPDHGPVEYEFHYSVHDPHTGDIKSQKESRKDDRVEGIYQLIDSDGHRRVVHYKADDHSGFEAVVVREPTDIKIPQPEHKLIATKILTHGPLVHYAHKP